jgi:hypothetical protein
VTDATGLVLWEEISPAAATELIWGNSPLLRWLGMLGTGLIALEVEPWGKRGSFMGVIEFHRNRHPGLDGEGGCEAARSRLLLAKQRVLIFLHSLPRHIVRQFEASC